MNSKIEKLDPTRPKPYLILPDKLEYKEVEILGNTALVECWMHFHNFAKMRITVPYCADGYVFDFSFKRGEINFYDFIWILDSEESEFIKALEIWCKNNKRDFSALKTILEKMAKESSIEPNKISQNIYDNRKKD